MQFLKDKSLIKRTDSIHEERFVKAAIGNPEGEFTLLVADSDGSDATEAISGSAEEIRSYIKRFGVPTHLCYVVDNKTGKLAKDFKWSGQANGAVDVDYDHMGVLNRLSKAGFIGKFKKGEESGVFYYRGIPVELRLGNENLYLTLPDIYSKESHGDIIDALAQFLSKVLDSGGAGKTRR